MLGMAAEGSSKEEVPDWTKADMRAMNDKFGGEVDWETEFGQRVDLEYMEKF